MPAARGAEIQPTPNRLATAVVGELSSCIFQRDWEWDAASSLWLELGACDSRSRVSECVSARGLGLNSSPGQPSRKCVSFLTEESRGAGERVCGSVESRLRRWKNNSKFTTPWLWRCDCKHGTGFFVFPQTAPGRQAQMSVLSSLVATLGGKTHLPLACAALLPAPWGRTGFVALSIQLVFVQQQHHPSLLSAPVCQT